MTIYKIRVENHTGYGEDEVEADSIEEACALAMTEIEVSERFEMSARPDCIAEIRQLDDDDLDGIELAIPLKYRFDCEEGDGDA